MTVELERRGNWIIKKIDGEDVGAIFMGFTVYLNELEGMVGALGYDLVKRK